MSDTSRFKVVLNLPHKFLPVPYVRKLAEYGNKDAKIFCKEYDELCQKYGKGEVDHNFSLNDLYHTERHDQKFIEILEEWIEEKNPDTKDMEIIQLRGNKYNILEEKRTLLQILRQPDDIIHWIDIDAFKNETKEK